MTAPTDLDKAARLIQGGVRAHSARVRVAAENMQKKDVPNANRKMVTFKNHVDRASGVQGLKVGRVFETKKDERIPKHDPTNPEADEEGNVYYAPIDPLVEMIDYREATRTLNSLVNLFKGVQKSKQHLRSLIGK